MGAAGLPSGMRRGDVGFAISEKTEARETISRWYL